MHDRIEIVSTFRHRSAGYFREIRLVARDYVLRENDNVSVAIIAALFVIITNRVTDFMTDRAAIPGVRSELNELFASGHAHRRGKSAAEAGIFLHCHEIRRRSSGKFIEMDVCRCGPFRDAVTKLLHFRGGDSAV